jgi:hypothetical protein
MPNPLSSVRPRAGYVLAAVGTHSLRFNEKLARQAMEGISSWANVDFNMLQIYITLAGGAGADAATVFLSIESDGARKNAVAALAARKLDAQHQRIFSAILKVMGRRYRERNKLAHWVWGYSPQLPDALLLADPRAIALRMGPKLDDPVDNHVFVYTEADFSRILAANEEIAQQAFLFNWVIQKHPATSKTKLLQKICSVPEIAEILNPLQERASKS